MITPEQQALADTLSLSQLCSVHARAHEIYMTAFRSMANVLREPNHHYRTPYLREALETSQGVLSEGLPELTERLPVPHQSSAVRNER